MLEFNYRFCLSVVLFANETIRSKKTSEKREREITWKQFHLHRLQLEWVYSNKLQWLERWNYIFQYRKWTISYPSTNSQRTVAESSKASIDLWRPRKALDEENQSMDLWRFVYQWDACKDYKKSHSENHNWVVIGNSWDEHRSESVERFLPLETLSKTIVEKRRINTIKSSWFNLPSWSSSIS